MTCCDYDKISRLAELSVALLCYFLSCRHLNSEVFYFLAVQSLASLYFVCLSLKYWHVFMFLCVSNAMTYLCNYNFPSSILGGTFMSPPLHFMFPICLGHLSKSQKISLKCLDSLWYTLFRAICSMLDHFTVYVLIQYHLFCV